MKYSIQLAFRRTSILLAHYEIKVLFCSTNFEYNGQVELNISELFSLTHPIPLKSRI